MNFTTVEIEEVLNLYQDESQDPKYIAESTGLEINKVVAILEHLQSQGDIQGFNKIERKRNINEDRILLFSEAIVDPEVIKSLKLDKINDKNYFFDEKEIEEVYDAHIFEVKAEKAHLHPIGLIITLVLTIKMKDFNIFMVYTPDENVYYGAEDGENTIKQLEDALGDNWELFNDVTQQILDDHIPRDFWEVRMLQA